MKTYEVNKGGGVYEVIEVGDEIDAIIRRVAHQECDGSCDIALARRQVGPDGIVPGSAKECAELWEAEARRLRTERDAARQLADGLRAERDALRRAVDDTFVEKWADAIRHWRHGGNLSSVDIIRGALTEAGVTIREEP